MKTLPLLRFAILLAIAISAPALVHAQDVAVRGTLTGPDGAPLPNERVLLHRVDRTGGATIAETTSATDGAFVLSAPATADTAAVYFVAARYQGELYIGEMFRAVGNDTLVQPLQVGVAATSASALMNEATQPPPPPGRPATSTSWLLLLLPLLGIGAALIYMLVPRPRIAPDRALLIRIAEIDERIEAAPPGQRDAMRAERANLIEQLRAG